MQKAVLKAIILVIVLFLSLVEHVCSGRPEETIRVAVLQNASSLNFVVRGPYEILDLSNGRIIHKGKNLRTTLTLFDAGMLLGNIRANSNRVVIRPSQEGAVSINGRKYRGDVEFVKKGKNSILVVNRIGIEDYIRGILYHEVSHYWPSEALKAQAIVCRTYAVYQKQLNAKKDYDVTNDIYSQVYGGRSSERGRTNNAVKSTDSMVLNYQGKVFPAFFSATCAGHTEDAGKIWNIDLAPLKGVACSFCKESPHYSWHAVIPLDEISEKLSEAGFKVGRISSLSAVDKNGSGRVVNIKVIAGEKEFELPAKDFRNIIGPNSLRSLNFTVNTVENDAVFEGFGWGHGAGLCQWGAYFMAKEGKNFNEILQYYYPGSSISLKNN